MDETNPLIPGRTPLYPSGQHNEIGEMIDQARAVIAEVSGTASRDALILIHEDYDGAGGSLPAIDGVDTHELVLQLPSTFPAGLPSGQPLLVAATQNPDVARDLLNRARVLLHSAAVTRIAIHDHMWRNLDTGVNGHLSTTPGHTPAAVIDPDIADRFTPRGPDLTPALLAGEATWSADVLGDREKLAAERDWITDTVRQAITHAEPLSDKDAVRMLLDIANPELRDHALAGVSPTTAHTHAPVWADLTARAPEAYRDAPAATTAFTLWLDSRPDEARHALDQVPHRFTSNLAQLVECCLDTGLDASAMPPSPQVELEWPPRERIRPVSAADLGSMSPTLPARPAPTLESATPTHSHLQR